MKKSFKGIIVLAFSIWFLSAGYFLAQASTPLTDKGYRLEKVVVMSRHNMRTPIVSKGSVAYKINTAMVHDWPMKGGHLTLKGALNETAFGQYFRCYLMDEGFMPEDWIPQAGQVSFYTNSYQRTIATARYFASGMLPMADIKVEHKFGIDKSDPVFIQARDFYTPKLYELGKDFHEKSIDKYLSNIDDKVLSFERAVDFSNTPYAKEKGITHLSTNDIRYIINGPKKPTMTFEGQLYDVYKTTDSLIMHFYEETDDYKLFEGAGLTARDWQNIGDLHTAGMCMICENPALALENTHRLLKVIDEDLRKDNLKFAFIGGHDTNIIMLMTVLGAGDYWLPNTITAKAPIGGKIVFEKRVGRDGRVYLNPYFIYQSDDQVRHCAVLDLNNPPMRYGITFKGIEKNEDGLYLYEDFQKLLKDISVKYEYYTNKQ